ncbi:MAG: IMP dehydrogenase [Deltaproteobacteria bacterium]|nr:IMP dehydrogenase [Deltaproteobacteria bacterium]
MNDRTMPVALTFDDVLLVPGHSTVLPSEVAVTTRLARGIALQIPLVSSAMDTVTESATAICLAREGGLGIVHRNLSPADQAKEVLQVKRAETGMVVDPLTVHPDQRLGDAIHLMQTHSFSGLPVVKEGRLVGILTNRDVRFEKNLDQRVADLMTEELVTAPEGVDLERAKELLHTNRIEKLLVVDGKGMLKGLITIKDIEKAQRHPFAAKDDRGRLRVGAAVGVGADREERVARLVEAGCDVICVDTAHGHSQRVIDTVAAVRASYPDLPIVAGNVATAEGAEALAKAGADAIKVGIGPGSICTTRVVTGVGVPQMTAIWACAPVAERHGATVIADGGIKYSGDVAKALAAGAHVVMVGSLFAGTDEAPGEKILYQGRSYKMYRGMGSLGAMQDGSRDRYFQMNVTDDRKLVPEGIEGRVPYRGPLADSVYQLIGGVRAAMGYVGAATLAELRTRARFVQVTAAGQRESHVHDVIIMKEAPNYRVE